MGLRQVHYIVGTRDHPGAVCILTKAAKEHTGISEMGGAVVNKFLAAIDSISGACVAPERSVFDALDIQLHHYELNLKCTSLKEEPQTKYG